MKKKIYILLICGFALAACTEELTSPSAQDGRISFAVSMDDGDIAVTRALNGHNCKVEVGKMNSNYPEQLYLHTITSPWRATPNEATRSTMINELSQVSSFGVSGYHYTPGTLAAQKANLFYNGQATQQYIGLWNTNASYYFPQSNEKVAFYAYLPYGGTDLTLAPEATTGPMTISYKVDLSKSDQTDLMTAVTKDLDFNPAIEVPLTFRHALTAVSIELGDQVATGNIEKIFFDNIAYEGTYRVGQGWTATTTSTDTLFYNNLTTAPELTIIADNSAIFMIPQTFTNDAQRINVVLSDDEGTYLLRKSLKGSEWKEGTAVKYQITTSSINFAYVNTVNYPTRWGATPFSMKNNYSTGESIGVFTVDKTTGQVLEANVEYKRDSNGKWKSTSDRLHFEENRVYYAYYPYRSTLTGAPAIGSSVTADTDAATFFSGAMQSWPISLDQGTESKLLANDMQISKATNSSTSTLQFNMEHAMGLAEITLEQKVFNGNINYYLSTDANYQWTGVATETIRASEKLGDDRKAYKVSDTEYYYIVRPNTATTFTCGVSNVANAWDHSETVTIGSGARGGFTALVSSNTTLPAEKEWVLTVGDVYFSDGALGKNVNTYSNKTAVGLVIKVGTISSDQTAGYTHAYVVCAKNVSNGTTDRWAWRTSNYTVDASAYIQSTARNVIVADKEGLAKTEKIRNISGYMTKFPAVAAIDSYALPCPTDKTRCSGWFLPAIGQLDDWIWTAGSQNIGNSESYAYGFSYKNKNTYTVNAMNAFFTDRGFTTATYTPLYASTNANALCAYWSVTEYSNRDSFCMDFYIDNSIYMDFDTSRGYAFLMFVRPMLVF